MRTRLRSARKSERTPKGLPCGVSSHNAKKPAKDAMLGVIYGNLAAVLRRAGFLENNQCARLAYFDFLVPDCANREGCEQLVPIILLCTVVANSSEKTCPTPLGLWEP